MNDDKTDEPLQLRGPADLDRLPVVRAITRTLAVLGDFTPDEIADITLATDEICTQLIASALTGSDLRCTFTAAEHGLPITIRALLGRPGVPAREGIEWHVLDTLTA
ncbi:MAG: ATP-binding protein [Rhodococcus sp. (in: high G+C Gram-positive bacteria)]|nr:MAG: ATP-binding protein [Rhodococcus sp. (in: high G+C Gram-positive bacteria)]